MKPVDLRESPQPVADPGGAVEIGLLGGFRVRVGDLQLGADDWPSLRAAQLVQLLGLAPQHRLPREQAIQALWPQLDPDAGGANLRKAAHHARQAMGQADAVRLQGGQVLLCPLLPVTVDAERFEQRAQAALGAGDALGCAEAARAYGGELLPGSRYEEWTEAARRRLHSRYLDVLRASSSWERLAEVEPTDEVAHRESMRRALAAGNRAAAIGWYARLRMSLQQSLGLLPDRETESLYDACVAGLRRPDDPFVGRDMELAEATAWLRAPAEERQGGLVVRGPAGIGKSAFCRQVDILAVDEGWTVLRVEAAPASRPYAVVAAVLDQLVGRDRGLLDAIGESARSVLALMNPIAGPAQPLQGPIGRHQVIGALRRLLLTASAGGPALLHVDDAHLVDEADADVLLHLTSSGRPVATMLALRPQSTPGHLERGLARLERGDRLLVVALGALADADVASLVKQVAATPPEAALRARIVAVAAGNPFAALELARGADANPARLPGNLRDAITARLCDVDEATLTLLRRLALAGGELGTAEALALCASAEEEAFALLDRALREGVLVVANAGYRFRHELVRQALADQVPPHRRLRIHRDAAKALTGLGAAPTTIARHWLAGGSPIEATPWLLAAAREASRLGAFTDALRQLQPVLEHDAGHAEALGLRAEALDATGDPGAMAAYAAAAVAAGEPGSHDLRAKGALAQIKLGDPKGALLALQGVTPTTLQGRLSEALTFSGAAAMGFIDPATGTRKSAEARRIALQTGDSAAIVVASWAQAAAAHARGELHGSVWADLHETHHLPHLALRVFDGQLCITQRFLYGARPYPEVISFADALSAEAQRLGAARGHAFGVTLRGEAELLAGQLDAAEEHLALGGRLHRALGGATGEALSLQRRAEIALHRGHRDSAGRLLDEALDLARQTDIGFHLLDRIYGTRVAAGADPQAALAAMEDAQEAVRGPLETCPGCRITFAVPAAIAAARARRHDLAARYEKEVHYLATVVMQLPAWHAALDEVRAHIALSRDDGEAAAASFAAAAARFRAAGQPLDAARCSARAGPAQAVPSLDAAPRRGG